jgi:para-nitrobenzyl esterase
MTSLPAATAQTVPHVRIATGVVAGVSGFDTQAFLGVPFAAPPVGTLRWQSPAPVKSWTGTLDASKLPPICAAAISGDGPRSTNEDCLYLNLYRPSNARAEEKLPVMVFFHGGGNLWGSPDIYDGVRMAEVGHAIVVMPAFRLGVFGLLALPDFGPDGGTFLLQDQLAALRWVKQNVAAFGGDPSDVTVSGQSAGSFDVCTLLASPAAAGLFRQAIMQSGACLPGPSRAEAQTNAQAFAQDMGCTGPDAAACLRSKPAGEVLDKWKPGGGGYGGTPYGGALLPVSAEQAMSTGHINKVPLLIGFARDEWWPFEHALYPLSEQGYQDQLNKTYGARAAKVAALYPEAAYPHREYALGAPMGDSFFICPSFADALSAANFTKVSMYEFADRTVQPFKSLGVPQNRPPGYNPGAFHTGELQYLYNYQAAEGPLSAAQRRLGDKLIQMWVGFNRARPDMWPAFDSKDRTVTVLGEDGASVQASTHVYDEHQCGFWTAQ